MGSKTLKNTPLVFLAFANDRTPDGSYLRNLPAEQRQIREALSPAVKAGHCEILERSNVTLGEIQTVLLEEETRSRLAIFHFAGHSGDWGVLLSDKNEGLETVTTKGLGGLLKSLPEIKLVFLNSCSTRAHGRRLLDDGIPAALTTSEAISDQAAIDFATAFYKSLAEGNSLIGSEQLARSCIELKASHESHKLYQGEIAYWLQSQSHSYLPWHLQVLEGAEEQANTWNLPMSVQDHYFGIPTPAPSDLPHYPFKPLSAFGKRDADIFFGRGAEIRRLYHALSKPERAPILLLFGRTGVGKSSLLNAGLVPRLQQSFDVISSRRDPTLGSLGTLLHGINAGPQLTEAWHKREKQNGPLIIILDQLEELFTRQTISDQNNQQATRKYKKHPAEELIDLQNALRDTFAQRSERPQGRLVLSFRKEWLSNFRRLMIEAGLPFTIVEVLRLQDTGIQEAVSGLTSNQRLREHYNLTIERDLASIISSDLLQDPASDVGPILQIILSKMWTLATRDNIANPVLSTRNYLLIKRQGTHLNDYFEEQIRQIRTQHPSLVTSGLLLDLLHWYTTPLSTSQSRPILKTRQRYDQVANLQEVLDYCVKLRLLTRHLSHQDTEIASKEAASNQGFHRLSHDILAPLVRSKFDSSDRPGQRARRILESRSAEWRAENSKYLFGSEDLKIIENGLDGMRSLDEDEFNLLSTSQLAVMAHVRKQRKQVLIQRIAAITIALLSVLSIIIISSNAASKLEAYQNLLVSEALKANKNSIDESLLLGFEAMDLSPELGTQVLTRALVQEPYLETFLHDHYQPIRYLSHSFSGKYLASSGESDKADTGGKITLWDKNTRRKILDPPMLRKDIQTTAPLLTFIRRGDRLVYSDGGCLRMWDPTLRHLINTNLPCEQGDDGNHREILSIAYSESTDNSKISRQELAVSWEGGPIRIINLETSESRDIDSTEQFPASKQAQSLDIDSSSQTLVIGGNDSNELCKKHHYGGLQTTEHNTPDGVKCGCLTILDIATGSLRAPPVCIPNITINSLDYDHNSGRIASGWSDGSVRIWINQQSSLKLSGITDQHSNGVTKVQFNHSGSMLATTDWGGSAILWNSEHEEIEKITTYRWNTGGFLSATFSPAGVTPPLLATGTSDQKIIFWLQTLNSRSLLAVNQESLKRHAPNSLCCIKFTPDGSKLLSAGANGIINLWDHLVSKKIGTASTHPDTEKAPRINTLEINEQQNIFATGSSDGVTRIWDLDSLDFQFSLDVKPSPIRSHRSERVRTIDFNSSGTSIIISAEGPLTSITELDNSEEPLTHEHKATRFKLKIRHSDNSVFTVNSDGQLINWNTELTKINYIIPHHHPSTTMEISNNESMLALSKETRILIYDLEEADRINTNLDSGTEIALSPKILDLGHSNVRSLTFDTADQKIVAGYNDGSIIVWDLNAGTPAGAPLRGHSIPVVAVDYSPTTPHFASGDDQGNIVLWHIESLESFDEAACFMANRDLTPTELEAYARPKIFGWELRPLSQSDRRSCSGFMETT